VLKLFDNLLFPGDDLTVPFNITKPSTIALVVRGLPGGDKFVCILYDLSPVGSLCEIPSVPTQPAAMAFFVRLPGGERYLAYSFAIEV